MDAFAGLSRAERNDIRRDLRVMSLKRLEKEREAEITRRPEQERMSAGAKKSGRKARKAAQNSFPASNLRELSSSKGEEKSKKRKKSARAQTNSKKRVRRDADDDLKTVRNGMKRPRRDSVVVSEDGKQGHTNEATKGNETEDDEEDEEEEEEEEEEEDDDDVSEDEKVGPYKRPQGAAPTGKRWDTMKGLWVEKPHYEIIRKLISFLRIIHGTKNPRPRGAPPVDQIWDFEKGKWVDEKKWTKDVLSKGPSFLKNLEKAAMKIDAAKVRELDEDAKSIASKKRRKKKRMNPKPLKSKPWQEALGPTVEDVMKDIEKVKQVDALVKDLKMQGAEYLKIGARLSGGNLLSGWSGLEARFKSWSNVFNYSNATRPDELYWQQRAEKARKISEELEGVFDV